MNSVEVTRILSCNILFIVRQQHIKGTLKRNFFPLLITNVAKRHLVRDNAQKEITGRDVALRLPHQLIMMPQVSTPPSMVNIIIYW